MQKIPLYKYLVFCFISIFLAGLIYYVYSQTTKLSSLAIDSNATLSLIALESNIHEISKSLSRMQNRISHNIYKNNEAFETDARMYLYNLRYIKLIALLDNNNEAIKIISNEYKYKIFLKDLMQSKKINKYTDPINGNISKPIKLGNTTVQIISTPAYNAKIVIFLNLKRLIDKLNIHNNQFYIELFANHQMINNQSENKVALVKRESLSILGSDYQIALYAKNNSAINNIKELTLSLFLLFLASITLLVFFIIRSRMHHDVKSTMIKSIKNAENAKRDIIDLQNRIKRYLLALNAGDIGIWIWDIKNDKLEWNECMYRMYQVPLDVKPTFNTWASKLLSADKNDAINEVNKALIGEKTFNTTFRIITEKEIKYIKAYGKTERNLNGEAIYFTGVNIDISQPIYFRELCNKSGFLFWKFNYQTKSFTFSNEGAHHLEIPTELIESYPLSLLIKRVDQKSKEILQQELLVNIKESNTEYFEINVINQKNTTYFAVYITERTCDSDNYLLHGFLQNISMLKKYIEKTYQDDLTKLLNRAGIIQKLSALTEGKEREEDSFAILFIDIDNLKYVNDQFGHEYGDMLLKKAAYKISESLRSTDVAGRIGGDEFIIICQHVGEHEAMNIAKKISNALSFSMDISSETLSSSASIGVAIYPKHATESEVLIKYADNAMYKAKKLGKNRVILFSKT